MSNEANVIVAGGLEWLSGTPEGARLGQLAVSQVEVVITPIAWWFFPLEPWRWFFAILGEAAHSFHAVLNFLVLSLILGLAVARSHGWRAGTALTLTSSLFLTGGMESMTWLRTQVSHGRHWIVPANATYRLADLHCHTQASGGSLMPADALRWHIERGYSVVAITDSNKTYGGELAQQEARRLNLPIIVVCGEEYRGVTHLLMLNLKKAISADEVPLPEAVKQARAQGALVLGAHTWTGKYTAQELLDFGVQGFEVINARTPAGADIFAVCQKHRLAELGSLDFRGGADAPAATVLPLWADTPEKVQQALERGECAALYVPTNFDSRNFSRIARLRVRIPEYFQEGGRLLLPGLLFWVFVGWAVRKGAGRIYFAPIPKDRQNRILVAMVVVAALSGGLTIWSMWWKFKPGWYPAIEWGLAFWLGACSWCSLQCWRLTSVTTQADG